VADRIDPPGATQLTVMPAGASSLASARVSPPSAAFAATTPARLTAPVYAVKPPMLTIAAPSLRALRASSGSAACEQ
jgi:hypothetical protein